LISRNVTIAGRRTSLRLEKEMWEALADIASREGMTIHELCTLIEGVRGRSSRTSAVRAFVVAYLRLAAALTPAGQAKPPVGRARARPTPRPSASLRRTLNSIAPAPKGG
jgi:predicted DNA-binding ribbon-helix-helix protein